MFTQRKSVQAKVPWEQRIQLPSRQKCDNTHKKDTLLALYEHLESVWFHKYIFKPSHQVKYTGKGKGTGTVD